MTEAATGPGPHGYGRILLKLSGEALLGNRTYGVDPEFCAFIAAQVAAVHGTGVEGGIVGGVPGGVVGGVIGGVLWETIGWGFASFIVTSTRYAAVYSGFAILILFLIWLYLSWLILLVGAEVSFYVQHPHYLVLERDIRVPDTRLVEQAAVSVMFLVAHNFYHNKPPWTVDSLAQRLGVSIARVEEIVEAMEQKALIAETAGDPPAYLPARDIETITVHDVYEAVRGTRSGAGRQRIAAIGEVEDVVKAIDRAIGTALNGRTLRAMVRSRNDGGEGEKGRQG